MSDSSPTVQFQNPPIEFLVMIANLDSAETSHTFMPVNLDSSNNLIVEIYGLPRQFQLVLVPRLRKATSPQPCGFLKMPPTLLSFASTAVRMPFPPSSASP